MGCEYCRDQDGLCVVEIMMDCVCCRDCDGLCV